MSSTLPTEIVAMIVDIVLHYNEDLATTYSLLLANKALFVLAARLLWHNPIQAACMAHNPGQASLRLIDTLLLLVSRTDTSVRAFCPHRTAFISKFTAATTTLARRSHATPSLTPTLTSPLVPTRSSVSPPSATTFATVLPSFSGEREPTLDYLGLMQDQDLRPRELFLKIHQGTGGDLRATGFNVPSSPFSSAVNTPAPLPSHDTTIIAELVDAHIMNLLKVRMRALHVHACHILYGLCHGTSRRLENVVSLQIPNWDMESYRSVIHRLVSLETLWIYDQSSITGASGNRGGDRPMDGDAHHKSIQQQVEMAIDFFMHYNAHHKEHSRLKNVLLECIRPNGERTRGVRPVISASPAVWQSFRRLYDLLPPMDRPTALAEMEWLRYSVKHDGVDLSQVRRVEPVPFFTSRSLIQAVLGQAAGYWKPSQARFLQQCRRLESLNIQVLEKDLFQWAVKEKTGLLGTSLHTLTEHPCRSSPSNFHHQLQKEKNSSHPLVNLKQAALSVNTDLAEGVVSDLIHGFCHSLEELTLYITSTVSAPAMLTMDFLSDAVGSTVAQYHTTLGNGWGHCSRLRKAKIYTSFATLDFDFSGLEEQKVIVGKVNQQGQEGNAFLSSSSSNTVALSSSPLPLESLELRETLHAVDLRRVPQSFGRLELLRPCQSLHNIRRLLLSGRSCEAFHPGSLHAMAKLEYLCLKGVLTQQDGFYLPQPAALAPLTQNSDGGPVPPYSFMQTQRSAQRPRKKEATPQERPGDRLPLAYDTLWTWDWVLPHLRTMLLQGSWAYRFSFGWLKQLQGLEQLCLDIGGHSRRIDGELIAMAQEWSPPPNIALGVRDLYLRGSWRIDDAALAALLKVVAYTHLETLLLGSSVEEYTAATLVQLTRDMPRLRNVWSGMNLVDDKGKIVLATNGETPMTDFMYDRPTLHDDVPAGSSTHSHGLALGAEQDTTFTSDRHDDGIDEGNHLQEGQDKHFLMWALQVREVKPSEANVVTGFGSGFNCVREVGKAHHAQYQDQVLWRLGRDVYCKV